MRFFNDLQTRGERLKPPKSYKTSLFVDRIVDRNFDLAAAATSVSIFLKSHSRDLRLASWPPTPLPLGAAGFEPATSAVTDPRWLVTHRNQKARMANFGALETLRNAYRTLNKPSTSALLSSTSTLRFRGNTRNRRMEETKTRMRRFSLMRIPFGREPFAVVSYVVTKRPW